jgi:hypothetical protein
LFAWQTDGDNSLLLKYHAFQTRCLAVAEILQYQSVTYSQSSTHIVPSRQPFTDYFRNDQWHPGLLRDIQLCWFTIIYLLHQPSSALGARSTYFCSNFFECSRSSATLELLTVLLQNHPIFTKYVKWLSRLLTTVLQTRATEHNIHGVQLVRTLARPFLPLVEFVPTLQERHYSSWILLRHRVLHTFQEASQQLIQALIRLLSAASIVSPTSSLLKALQRPTDICNTGVKICQPDRVSPLEAGEVFRGITNMRGWNDAHLTLHLPLIEHRHFEDTLLAHRRPQWRNSLVCLSPYLYWTCCISGASWTMFRLLLTTWKTCRAGGLSLMNNIGCYDTVACLPECTDDLTKLNLSNVRAYSNSNWLSSSISRLLKPKMQLLRRQLDLTSPIS